MRQFPERRSPLEWWSRRPRWLKYTLAVMFFSLSVALWIAGWIWPWGYGIGLALLIDAWFFGD